MESMTKLMLLTFVAVFAAVGPASAQVRGSWPLNEGSGNTAYDASGNGNDGTLVNGATWVPGISGNAVEFDGIDDRIDIDDNHTLDITNNLRIDVWIKPYTNDKLMNIVTKWGIQSGANRNYDVNIGGYPYNLPHGSLPGHVCLLLTPDGYTHYILSSRDVVPANQWTHILATYDNDVMTLYINDILDTTLVVPMGGIFKGNAKLQIGSSESEPIVYKYYGIIDEVSVAGDTNSTHHSWDDAEGIASLTDTGLVILGAVLAFVAIYFIRRRNQSPCNVRGLS